MRVQGRTSTLLLWLAALALAVIAGIAIPLAGGRSSGPVQADWTPPSTETRQAAAAMPTPTLTKSPKVTRTAIGATSATAATVKPPATATAPPRSLPTASPTPRATATAAATSIASDTARIQNGPVNLRSGPGKSYSVLKTAKTGEEFRVTGRSEDALWLQLCCVAKLRVWVSADLVELAAKLDTFPIVR